MAGGYVLYVGAQRCQTARIQGEKTKPFPREPHLDVLGVLEFVWGAVLPGASPEGRV